MKRSLIPAAAAVLAVLTFSGCAAQEAVKVEAEAPAVAKIDPGPVELTLEEAGERYLNIVCPNNQGNAALYAATSAGEEEYLNGGAPDPAAVTAAAAALIELNRAAVEAFDDEYFTWPAKVAEQVPHMRAVYMGQLTMNQAASNATTFAAAYNTTLPVMTPEMETAGQEIRYQLDISADTEGSCVGYEDGIAVLTAERTEREAALAKQD